MSTSSRSSSPYSAVPVGLGSATKVSIMNGNNSGGVVGGGVGIVKENISSNVNVSNNKTPSGGSPDSTTTNTNNANASCPAGGVGGNVGPASSSSSASASSSSGSTNMYSLKWNTQLISLSRSLANLWDMGIATDAVLLCQGTPLPVHKIVLVSASPYVASVVQTMAQNSQTHMMPVICIDIPPEAGKALLSFLYCGEAHVPVTIIPHLVIGAKFLGISGFGDPGVFESLTGMVPDLSTSSSASSYYYDNNNNNNSRDKNSINIDQDGVVDLSADSPNHQLNNSSTTASNININSNNNSNNSTNIPFHLPSVPSLYSNSSSSHLSVVQTHNLFGNNNNNNGSNNSSNKYKSDGVGSSLGATTNRLMQQIVAAATEQNTNRTNNVNNNNKSRSSPYSSPSPYQSPAEREAKMMKFSPALSSSSSSSSLFGGSNSSNKKSLLKNNNNSISTNSSGGGGSGRFSFGGGGSTSILDGLLKNPRAHFEAAIAAAVSENLNNDNNEMVQYEAEGYLDNNNNNNNNNSSSSTSSSPASSAAVAAAAAAAAAAASYYYNSNHPIHGHFIEGGGDGDNDNDSSPIPAQLLEPNVEYHIGNDFNSIPGISGHQNPLADLAKVAAAQLHQNQLQQAQAQQQAANAQQNISSPSAQVVVGAKRKRGAAVARGGEKAQGVKIKIKKPPETIICEICGKKFSNAYNLRVHMEGHSGQVFVCSVCSHASRSRDALRKHFAYRHRELWISGMSAFRKSSSMSAAATGGITSIGGPATGIVTPGRKMSIITKNSITISNNNNNNNNNTIIKQEMESPTCPNKNKSSIGTGSSLIDSNGNINLKGSDGTLTISESKAPLKEESK